MSMYLSAASIKKKLVTIMLVLMNVTMYLVVNVYLNSKSGVFWLHNLAMYSPSIFMFGQYYRLFTAMLVHANLVHLLSNMFGLIIFGLLVENKYSVLQYLFIYFFSGFVGNVASLFIIPDAFSLGASGAIFGVMAAYYVSFTAYNKRMILYAIGASIMMVVLSIGAAVNSWAHLLGALGGLLFGYIFTQFNKKRNQNRSSTRGASYNKENVDDDYDKYHYKPSHYDEDNTESDYDDIDDY
jgi:rhomboid protease GluP